MMTSAILKIAPVVLLYGWFLRQGYVRRRAVWNPSSWRRFAIFLILGLSLLALSLRMAVGVDNGVYQGMSARARNAYFYTLMASTLLGTLLINGLILWFARGRPDRQLGPMRLGGRHES